MELGQFQRRLAEYTSSLFQEGILDNQFTLLKQLQDESNPNFVSEVVALFFEDSEKIIMNLTKALDQQCVDFKSIDSNVHQLKGTTSSIGAQKVMNACLVLRDVCRAQNSQACSQCLHQVKLEYAIVKNRLQTLMEMEQQVVQLVALFTIEVM